jgi:hypothetical protein
LVLEFLWWSALGGAEPAEISPEAMKGAIELVRTYFLPMMMRVLGNACIPAERRAAQTLARWILKQKSEKINITSIRDQARIPGLRRNEEVKSACLYLVEAGWLRAPQVTGKAGRPRGDYIVDPGVWIGNP